MALLFLKQKFFPREDQQKLSGKRLLSRYDDSSDTVSEDLEAQGTRSYDTFGNRPQYNDDDQEEDASSTSSSRSRINPRIVSDAILGLSDGLTVPFALSAGLSALGDTKVVVLGGLAELAAGAISMGLGGYVGAKSEAYVFLLYLPLIFFFVCLILLTVHSESYEATVRETQEMIRNSPAETASIVHDTFSAYGLTEEVISDINNSLHSSPSQLRDFLVAFHHKETEPDCNQAWMSAITLALGYFVGGFIPLIPYFIAHQVIVALYWSIGVMGVTLFAFGYTKTCIVRGWRGSGNVVAGINGGLQMCLVGGIAAGAAIGLVQLIDRT
ncbi:hypothetical protein ASPZODRAFT_1460225 [Penicilliopsis zonata CBS 506.65]|uniref:Uncharacterized protein n=1 Tax=Penicilliopsis zonata CBS 506.65 TaxID=1073090 RepID=A0A1L9SQH7_9EURO|nr:hypothetical protein ASPZODRAFT_1460225 [Penicilliopsis zonata CBS 506.65]OJJ49343.1 hypothetical protein ASPZODRAFT_1460225 [Penicilliopsis zonata CBS 506.65]